MKKSLFLALAAIIAGQSTPVYPMVHFGNYMKNAANKSWNYAFNLSKKALNLGWKHKGKIALTTGIAYGNIDSKSIIKKSPAKLETYLIANPHQAPVILDQMKDLPPEKIQELYEKLNSEAKKIIINAARTIKTENNNDNNNDIVALYLKHNATFHVLKMTYLDITGTKEIKKTQTEQHLLKLGNPQLKTLQRYAVPDNNINTLTLVDEFFHPTSIWEKINYGLLRRPFVKILMNVTNFFWPQATSDQSKNDCLLRIHKKQKEEENAGNYTFVHAQQWQWHLRADIFKKLWETAYKEKINDYQFLRFIAKEKTLWQHMNSGLKWLVGLSGNDLRDKSIKTGRTDDNRQDLLFMNHALFGNIGNFGSCSIHYFCNDHDMSQKIISLADIFKEYGLATYAEKYKPELAALEQLHKKAQTNNTGNMLLLSFAPGQINEMVYPAQSGGDKGGIYINNGQTLKWSTNSKEILDTLKNNPQFMDKNEMDALEYVMPLYGDSLHPQKGPRIFSFNTANTKKYEEYRDQLFAKIAADLEQDNVNSGGLE